MRALTVLSLAAVLMLASQSPADAPSPSAEAVHVLDLALMSHSDAVAAEGHQGLFRVDLDSRPGDGGTHTVYDCASPQRCQRHSACPGFHPRETMKAGPASRPPGRSRPRSCFPQWMKPMDGASVGDSGQPGAGASGAMWQEGGGGTGLLMSTSNCPVARLTAIRSAASSACLP
jgi:hypothetical protein